MSAITVASLRDLAQTKINEWGSSIVLKKPPTQAGYDFVTGKPTPSIPNDINLKGVISNYSGEETDNLVMVGDLMVMVDFTQSYSLADDKIAIGTNTYNIVAVMPEMHTDIVVFQNLLLRK